MFDPYDPAPLAEPDTFTFPPVEQEIHPYPELPAWARRRLPHGV